MHYRDVLKRLYGLNQEKGKPHSLSTMKELVKIFNHPENDFATIHVAGTNGKGSVCTKIAAALELSGYKTALYTSPHISCYRERIQVDAKMITKEELCALFSDLQKKVDIRCACFFEITTLLAFLYFRQKKVDVAVIETGLGGRLDATNVISPIVSVITSIGLDHCDILGETIEAITQEKAGIIKTKTPVVLGPDVCSSFIKERADRLSAPIMQSYFRDKDYDRENQETARLILEVISQKFSLSKNALEIGLRAKPSCRFEEHLFNGKKVVFDVAHNSHGFRRLIEKLKMLYPEKNFHFLVGFSRGHKISECAELLLQLAKSVYIVSALHPRLMSVDEIEKAFSDRQLVVKAESIESALDEIIEKAAGDIIVITGSFFIMSYVREHFGISEPTDF